MIIMNYSAASSGVSKKTKIFGAASGGEPSARRSIAKSPIKLNVKNKSDSKGAFGNALIEWHGLGIPAVQLAGGVLHPRVSLACEVKNTSLA
jgi:hypothetical protein